ncbi:hypothetical protein BDV29DRAFT_183784 [Aspergillus leporis]|uniref:Uncharacterized protein n=1 Tax=Aspergillus leporis TaxID=41062 RepID=A0A5N5WP87_9EURO|nr:hypothetical protein BDV29DRAFT_183784 [Aspergillus leporis]
MSRPDSIQCTILCVHAVSTSLATGLKGFLRGWVLVLHRETASFHTGMPDSVGSIYHRSGGLHHISLDFVLHVKQPLRDFECAFRDCLLGLPDSKDFDRAYLFGAELRRNFPSR